MSNSLYSTRHCQGLGLSKVHLEVRHIVERSSHSRSFVSLPSSPTRLSHGEHYRCWASVIRQGVRNSYSLLWSLATILYGGQDIPSVDYCRKCRDVADRFNECLVAILLARNDWKTLHTDATTRRQTPFEALIIGLEGEEDEVLDNILVSSCIFMETEDAKSCVDGLERKVSTWPCCINVSSLLTCV